jgi:hypothetical protein
MESHEVLRAAVEKVGVKQVAAKLGVSESLVYKWCQPKGGAGVGGAENPLDRLAELLVMTNDTGPLVWLCERSNGYFVPNPEPVNPRAAQNLLTVTQSILKEFSDLLEVVSHSAGNDGKISEKEATHIRREWDQLKSVTERFVKGCEIGTFRES